MLHLFIYLYFHVLVLTGQSLGQCTNVTWEMTEVFCIIKINGLKSMLHDKCHNKH